MRWLVSSVTFLAPALAFAQDAVYQKSNEGSYTTLLLLFGVCIFAYLIPAVIAIIRNHKNKLAIFMTNIFFGWTFLGWVVALVWSCTSNTSKNA